MADIKTVKFSDKDQEKMGKLYTSAFRDSVFLRTQPGGCVLPEGYMAYKDVIKNWKHRCGDTYVCGFPKTGTTWIQDLVWCIQNSCNLGKSKEEFVYARARYIDALFHFDSVKKKWPGPLLELTELASMQNIPEPRVYKTHLPFCLLPEKGLEESKVVLCLRNPKDTLVSYYHHEKLFKFCGYTGDFSTYFDLFMGDMVMFSPYFEYYVEAWEKRHKANICTVFYEDMKDDFKGGAKKIATFLNKELDEAEIEALDTGFNFKEMKKYSGDHWDKDTLFLNGKGSFFRKGTVGDWKEYFTDEMNKRMNEKIEKYFKPIGLEFRYE